MENFVDSVRWQLQKVSAEKEKFSADTLRLLGGQIMAIIYDR